MEKKREGRKMAAAGTAWDMAGKGDREDKAPMAEADMLAGKGGKSARRAEVGTAYVVGGRAAGRAAVTGDTADTAEGMAQEAEKPGTAAAAGRACRVAAGGMPAAARKTACMGHRVRRG